MRKKTIVAETSGGGERICWTVDKLQIGDNVVYETRKGKLIVLTVTQVANIPRRLSKKADRFIVQKIDMENYHDLMDKNEEKLGLEKSGNRAESFRGKGGKAGLRKKRKPSRKSEKFGAKRTGGDAATEALSRLPRGGNSRGPPAQFQNVAASSGGHASQDLPHFFMRFAAVPVYPVEFF